MIRVYKLIFPLLFCMTLKGQLIRDYVVNGSYEKLSDCTNPPVLKNAIGWAAIDSIFYAAVINHKCNFRVPKTTNTWQFPNFGNGYAITTFYWPGLARGYMRNRLRSTLIANHAYCVRFYINIANTSPRGMDGFGAYFADSSLDTITKCTIPLSYLNPQVKNPLGNVISDTLNWIPITGTFVATGNEKYMVIGNFLADNAVTTSTINGPFVNEEWTDVCIDDVSCFDIDLPAYAGSDKRCIVGDSVFLGSNDPSLDEFCTWYKLPNMATPIATVAGLYVKPVTTSTYVVRQQLWCSGVKYDTVVVYEDAVALEKLKIINEKLKISPNPAIDVVLLSVPNGAVAIHFQRLEILDAQMRVLKEIEVNDADESLTIITSDLANGMYVLRLMNKERDWVVARKLAVQR